MPFLLFPLGYFWFKEWNRTAIKKTIIEPSEQNVKNTNFIEKLYNYISKHEGKRNRAYDDATGKDLRYVDNIQGFATIGVGHKILSHEKFLIDAVLTDKQVFELFKQDVANRVLQVKNAIDVPIGENKLIALISFVFNLGIGTASKTIERINRKAPQSAILDNWELYNKTRINGQLTYSEGLHKRRLDEIKLYKG